MSKEINFEEKIKRLEEIVDLLQEGELSLDKSIEVFEEGAKISKELELKLKEVEEKAKKIQVEEK